MMTTSTLRGALALSLLVNCGVLGALAWQAQRLADHVAALPTLRADGLPEEPRRIAGALAAQLAPLTGDMLTMADIAAAETRLLALSDAIGQRYFLQLRKTQSADILA